MASFTYNQIKIAVDRAENAADTYINVASIQQDWTPAEFNDIKTLKRRIDDHLDIEFGKLKGQDGVSVESISLGDTTNDITVTFDDQTTQVFTDLDVSSIESYVIQSNDLIEKYDDKTQDNKGRIKGDSGNVITDASVKADGGIQITTKQDQYKVYGIDNFGEDPITSVKQEDGELYVELNGTWLPDPVGVVAGERGEDGVLLKEQSDQTILVTYDKGTEKATLTIPKDDGTEFVFEDIPYTKEVSTSPMDALDMEWNNGNDVKFTLPTGARLSLGDFNGVDGDDGDNRAESLGDPRKVNDSGNWKDDSAFKRVVFEDNDNTFDMAKGNPRLRYIAPIPPAKTENSPSPSTSDEQVLYLDGVYKDIYSDDVQYLDIYITDSGEFTFEVVFLDEDGKALRQKVGIGNISVSDGVSIESIDIEDNGDVNVKYVDDKNVQTIGNLKYDRIKEAAIDPLSDEIVIELESGITVSSTGVPDGDDGVVRSVQKVLQEYKDSNGDPKDGELIFEMTQGDSPVNVGVIRPLRSHTVDVNSSGDLSIQLDDEQEPTSYGNIAGEDSARDITDVLFDGVDLQLVVNGTTNESVLGSLEKFDDVDYDDATKQIKFTKGAREIAVAYTRPSDGDAGVLVDTWDITDTSNNRELTITLSDSTKPVDSLELDDKWLEDLTIDDQEDITITYGSEKGQSTDTTPAKGYHGVDGDFPKDISLDGPDLWAKDWVNDDTGAKDVNIGKVVPRTIEELYVDSDGSTAKIKYNEDDTASDITGLSLGGDDAKYPTDFTINGSRELVVTYNDGSDEPVGVIDGEDAVWITDIQKNANTIDVTFSDSSTKTLTFESLDGIKAKWPTDFSINQDRKFVVDYDERGYDGSDVSGSEVIDDADGLDAEWIKSVRRDGDDFYVTWNDDVEKNVGTITGFDGVDGVFIDSITINPARELVVTWHNNDKPDETVTTNIDEDYAVDTISLNANGEIEFKDTQGGVVTSDVVLRRVQDAYVDANTEIAYIETNYSPDISVGYTAGADYSDGRTIDSMDRTADKGDQVEFTLSDGVVIKHPFNRREILGGRVEGNDLVITFNDATEETLAGVRGDGVSIDIVDGFINQDYALVLTLNDPESTVPIDPIILPNVRGEDGNGIASATINETGELVLTMDDDSTINIGNIRIDFGFAPYDPSRTYNALETMTLDGKIYAAQRDGVDEDPTLDPSAWLVIRMEGDETPDAGRPSAVSPVNGEETTTKPFLVGGKLRNYYSPDVLGKREYQIDVEGGNFSAPVYSGSENRVDHQVSLELDPNLTYKWRMRDVVEQTGYTTAWSFPETFVVASTGVLQPSVNVSTGIDPNNVKMAAGFTGSAFSGNASHVSSDWQIVEKDTGDIVFEEYDSGDLESIVIPDFVLETGTDYKVRVRYASRFGKSAWSSWTVFTTSETFGDIPVKPVVSLIGDNLLSTVARPAFKFESNAGEYWDRYFSDKDVVTTWEVRDSSGSVVWTSGESSIDINQVQVGKVLTSGESHSIRVKYTGGGFSGDSLWSDSVSFIPYWSISKPTVTYGGDISKVDADATFSVTESTFSSNDEYRFTEWEVRDLTGNVLYDSVTRGVFDWTVFFDSTDALETRHVYVRHIGQYGVSEWASLEFVVTDLISSYVYTAGQDGTTKRLSPTGVVDWSVDRSSPVVDVSVNSGQNVVSVANDSVLLGTNGGVQWTDSTNSTCSVITQTGIIYLSNGSTVRVLDDTGTESGSFSVPTTVTAISVAYDNSYLYVGMTDGSVSLVNTGDLSNTWTVSHNANEVNDISCDDLGNVVYVAGDEVFWLNSVGGSVEWTDSVTGSTSVVLKNDSVFVGDSSGGLTKYTTTGAMQWSKNFGASILGLSADDYSGAYLSQSNGDVVKVSVDGDVLWTSSEHAGEVNALDTLTEFQILAPDNLSSEYVGFASPINLSVSKYTPTIYKPLNLQGAYDPLYAPDQVESSYSTT